MDMVNFKTENLEVDWLGLNISGSVDIKRIKRYLREQGFNYFYFINDEPIDKSFSSKKTYQMSLRQYNNSRWSGVRFVFSGMNAEHLYKLLRSGKFNCNKLNVNRNPMTIGRLDLVFVQKNLCLDNDKLDEFLLDCRSNVLNNTISKHVRLQNYPGGNKMLKINRRNNSMHYRIYKSQNNIRFEIELKNRAMRSVENYLFSQQFIEFEHELTVQFFKYSLKMLDLNYAYTYWILNFRRKHTSSFLPSTPLLITSYLKNKTKNKTENQEERRLLHLLQFLSFIHFKKRMNMIDLELEYKIKTKVYYLIKFPLVNFTKFIGFDKLKQGRRNSILNYFKQLQKLDPISTDFSDGSFTSYVIFPSVEVYKGSNNVWYVEILMCQDLVEMSYPLRLSKEFLIGKNTNDIRLKMWVIRCLAKNNLDKTLYFEDFFNQLNVQNKQLIEIKKTLLQLLIILTKQDLIEDKIKITLKKSGRVKEKKISTLVISDITRRILCVSLREKFEF